MSNDYYFKKWKDVLSRLEATVGIDLEYQETKAHEQKLCGMVQKLSGVLGSYISLYNDAVECMNQGLQVQKTKYVREIVHNVSKRIIELKHQLGKLEQSNYQFMARGLTNFKLTTAYTEFKDIPERFVRPPLIQAAIDGVWKTAREIKEKMEEEEKERQRQKELEEQEKNMTEKWWDAEETIESVKEEELDEEEIEKRKMINIIGAQERCRQITVRTIQSKQKRAMWEIVLLGLAKPQKPPEVQHRAASMIQKFARAYFVLKRKRILDCRRDALLSLRMCKKPSDVAKIRTEEISERRAALRKKYDDEWKSLYEKLRNKCLKERCDAIQEDYRDEIRNWFHKWYKEAWYFFDIPKPKEGGSILILKEEIPSPSEWKDQNQAFADKMKANKGKSPEQLKLEKKQAAREGQLAKKEEARKRKMEEKLLEKMMKNPQMHPGYKYPPSTLPEMIVEAMQSYHKEWDDLDIFETVDVKQKHVDALDKNNAWAEVKLAIRPNVDEDMRNELKKLKEALKEEYERLEEPWPTNIMPHRFPKIPKTKPVKGTISDKVVEQMVNLVMQGYLKQYPKTKFEDFKGEPNFAGDDLRCNFIHALPYGGETRNVWWERCTELVHGFNKILLVGPKGSGRTLLAYAMATVNEAVLFEIDICPADFGDASADELNDLSKSILESAKAAQPAVIYIKHFHRLFYSKVPPNEPVMDYKLLIKCLLKKLTKKFHKTDKVTIIGSCVDPWLTQSAKMLKLFPTVLMMPNTTYTTTAMILREWILNNRMIPPDLDVSCLAQVLQGFSFGYLLKALENFLSGSRIAKMAAYGLTPQEVLDFVLSDDSEYPVEYDKYLKWYTEKTNWGKKENKHLKSQLEFEELVKKYAEKGKKKKKGGTSAASSAVSSISGMH